jgi:hypothetical protein
MRNAARIKLGYYPLPPSEGSRLRQLLNFSPEPASVLDPCADTGAAFLQLTDGADVARYAVELDAERARQATEAGGDSHASCEPIRRPRKSRELLPAVPQPPYDSAVASFGNKRMEFLFLQRPYRWLVNGGILVMVVPHGQLQERVPLLAEAFSRFQVLR